MAATTAEAHPNIALIKYWGKQAGPGNRPATPSLSITLDTLCSTTTVADGDRDRIVLDGEETDDPKIAACLAMLRENFELGPLEITSANNFPTAAGLASSASGFAALITAINAHAGLGMSDDARSEYARKASGSAARSIYGGFVGLKAPEWIAEPLLDAGDWPLNVVIAITDENRKKVSSSAGMGVSEATSPYYEAWVRTTAEDYDSAYAALTGRDFERLAVLSESSCLKMHGVMQSSLPPMIYWRPASVACMHEVQALRAEGVPVFFTMDAGPQVKAVCLPEATDQVAERLGALSGVLATHRVGLGGGARVVSQ